MPFALATSPLYCTSPGSQVSSEECFVLRTEAFVFSCGPAAAHVLGAVMGAWEVLTPGNALAATSEDFHKKPSAFQGTKLIGPSVRDKSSL